MQLEPCFFVAGVCFPHSSEYIYLLHALQGNDHLSCHKVVHIDPQMAVWPISLIIKDGLISDL
ncbi:hypothetical protein BJV82DRAFT_619672 [Fennellomyces sp. T-0311]|nr:hypothetical protein BJV82DRAFT_619672 [Fennellomyces sp. T-0311]